VQLQAATECCGRTATGTSMEALPGMPALATARKVNRMLSLEKRCTASLLE
jgi:hypothetical protein